MPDQLNKQSIINLLIDSPLREPIKINLIDIVNNTAEPDLPKVYSTITKELEIFQKATERRMKLAEETIAKLGGTSPVGDTIPQSQAPSPVAPPSQDPVPTPAPSPALPPLDLPPLPTPPMPPQDTVPTPVTSTPEPALSVPPLDLPPFPAPTMPTDAPMPTPQPLGTPQTTSASDEDALAEIQKELDSLKNEASADVASAAAPVVPVVNTPQA